MRKVFPASDYRIQVIGTGDEGLEQLRTDPPDVILLDLSLSHQSGLEFYQQIRWIDASIPVIFVTRTRTADAAIEAMRQGAYDYLIKPLDLHHLQRVVGEALEVVRRMRQSTVVDEDPGPGRRGRHRRHQSRYARGVQGHRPRCCPGRSGADHW